mgnify:CR=1 FL=1
MLGGLSLETSWRKMTPRIDCCSIWGVILGVPKGFKIDLKMMQFSDIPRHPVFYDRRAQKFQNEVPKQSQNAVFSGVEQNLKIVFSLRRELSFRGLECSKIALFFELCS